MTELQIRTLIATHTVWKVEDRGPRTTELAKLTKVSKGTASWSIDALIREQLLTQDWYKGRRVRDSLRLTTRGVAFLEALQEWPRP